MEEKLICTGAPIAHTSVPDHGTRETGLSGGRVGPNGPLSERPHRQIIREEAGSERKPLVPMLRDQLLQDPAPLFDRLGNVIIAIPPTPNDGNRFVFADDRFLRLLGSDLSRFPLAWAMASSGAFPGVFNSVTLRRFSSRCTWVQSGMEP